jgi:hypothetical protein
MIFLVVLFCLALFFFPAPIIGLAPRPGPPRPQGAIVQVYKKRS